MNSKIGKTLLEILKTAKSWLDVFTKLEHLQRNGDQRIAWESFELFCKHYLLTSGDYKDVWLSEEAPPAVLRRLNLARPEHGYDLIVRTIEGEFGIVQCKFSGEDKKGALGWSKDNLSSWLAAGTKADFLVLFTNTSRVAQSVVSKASEKRYIQYDFQHLSELRASRIRQILSSLKGRRIEKVWHRPRAHQKQAIRAVLNGFKNESRGKLILPCAAGKTLTSLWIRERLNCRRVLVLVPSLSLLRQFKNDWRDQEKIQTPYFSICSDQDVSGGDSPRISVSEVEGRVTTDPEEIRRLLKGDCNKVVFSTYQSSPVLAEALKDSGVSFDLVVFDEAHRTAGNKNSSFATALSDKKVPAKKRLFMTATPRVVAKKVADSKGIEHYKYLADMNDSSLYGPTFFEMTFGDAIRTNPPILTDYKIVAVGVTDEEVHHWVKERRFANGTTINEIAHNVALEKVMQKQACKHAVTFHSRVAAAREFSERHLRLSPKTKALHVSGSQSSADRAADLDEFRSAHRAVISNARCLTEGVNIPEIDLVYFCDPKKSQVDIVQATGRAIRRHPGKSFGFIVVPVFHHVGESVEETIKSGCFSDLVRVIRAMSDQDRRIEEEIRGFNNKKGPRTRGRRLDISLATSARIELDGFEERLRNAIVPQVLKKSVIGFRMFEEARAFVHTLRIPTVDKWREYSKSSEKPADIPANPAQSYKSNGWRGMGDWLGTGKIAPQLRKYLPFQEARILVHRLKLKNEKEWRDYIRSGKLPENIPASPNLVYKNKGWKGLGDWLGTGTVATFRRQYLSFYKARAFVHRLKLENWRDWELYKSSGKLPSNIPANPEHVYKNKGWKGLGDWLGTGRIASQFRVYRSFREARSYIRKFKLKNEKEWRAFKKARNLPEDIPASPHIVYRNKGWISLGDWLGTGSISNNSRKYLAFREARKFVRRLKLRSVADWIKYIGSGKLPKDIPASPDRVYRDKGWKGMGDWLGNGVIAPRLRQYRSFREARAFVHRLKLKKQKEWVDYAKSGKLPKDIPASPARVYRDKGWKGFGDWLGNGVIAPRLRQYRSFREARAFVHRLKLKNQTEWANYTKSGKLPKDIPASPAQVYRDKGWKGMGDWLGTGAVATHRRQYLSFHEARAFVHRLKLKNQTEWAGYAKSGKLPVGIPRAPAQVYKKNGWKGFGDWLGTGNVAPWFRKFRSYLSAKKFVHGLRLKTTQEWRNYVKSGKLPEDIPANPAQVYRGKGWKGFRDWLGNRIRNRAIA
jgi:superfamily II DNA or RNA helicase